jgi:hypothetical protein
MIDKHSKTPQNAAKRRKMLQMISKSSHHKKIITSPVTQHRYRAYQVEWDF